MTKDHEDQTSPLSIEDFTATLITCKSLDAIMFFNCGYNAGASIPHKHLQVIPYSSLYNNMVPVEQAAKAYIEDYKVETKFFKLPQFNGIHHVFVRLPPEIIGSEVESMKSLEDTALIVENLYWDCMENLGNSDYDPSKSYNVILMRHFMLVVLRSKEGIKDKEANAGVTVNSLGYAGTFAVKNLESLEFLKRIGPTNLLK